MLRPALAQLIEELLREQQQDHQLSGPLLRIVAEKLLDSVEVTTATETNEKNINQWIKEMKLEAKLKLHPHVRTSEPSWHGHLSSSEQTTNEELYVDSWAGSPGIIRECEKDPCTPYLFQLNDELIIDLKSKTIKQLNPSLQATASEVKSKGAPLTQAKQHTEVKSSGLTSPNSSALFVHSTQHSVSTWKKPSEQELTNLVKEFFKQLQPGEYERSNRGVKLINFLKGHKIESELDALEPWSGYPIPHDYMPTYVVKAGEFTIELTRGDVTQEKHNTQTHSFSTPAQSF